jgi:hypothetical protein
MAVCFVATSALAAATMLLLAAGEDGAAGECGATAALFAQPCALFGASSGVESRHDAAITVCLIGVGAFGNASLLLLAAGANGVAGECGAAAALLALPCASGWLRARHREKP